MCSGQMQRLPEEFHTHFLLSLHTILRSDINTFATFYTSSQHSFYLYLVPACLENTSITPVKDSVKQKLSILLPEFGQYFGRRIKFVGLTRTIARLGNLNSFFMDTSSLASTVTTNVVQGWTCMLLHPLPAGAL